MLWLSSVNAETVFIEVSAKAWSNDIDGGLSTPSNDIFDISTDNFDFDSESDLTFIISL